MPNHRATACRELGTLSTTATTIAATAASATTTRRPTTTGVESVARGHPSHRSLRGDAASTSPGSSRSSAVVSSRRDSSAS
jgi:hypothetical protein